MALQRLQVTPILAALILAGCCLTLGRPAAAEEPQRQRPDAGIDTAVVTGENVNLREGPSTSSAVLLRLKRDSLLALLDREKTGSWYNVIHIESGKEGWISDSYARVTYSRDRRDAALFQTEEGELGSDPEVEVSNDSKKNLNLKVGNQVYVIQAYSRKTVHLSPGNYSYYASAAGVLPALGKHEFKSGYRYTWRFYIRTIRRR